MTHARLLAVTLILCSVSASAQESRWGAPISGNLASFHHLFFFDFLGTAATALEPWRLIPEQPADASSARNPLDRIPSRPHILGGSPTGLILFSQVTSQKRGR
jgi:hypothetical protein